MTISFCALTMLYDQKQEIPANENAERQSQHLLHSWTGNGLAWHHQ